MNPFSDDILADPHSKPVVTVASYHQDVLESLKSHIKLPQNGTKASVVVAPYPGMGKTHLLWRLINESSQSHIPVFIPPLYPSGDLAKGVLERVLKHLWQGFDAVSTPDSELWVPLVEAVLGNPDKGFASGVRDYWSVHYKLDRLASIERVQGVQGFATIDRGWAPALLDFLFAQNPELESYARSWMLGRYDDYLPSNPDVLDYESRFASRRLKQLSELFSHSKRLVLVFDQIDNYLLWGDASVKSFFALIESLLRECPHAHAILSVNSDDFEEMQKRFNVNFIEHRLRKPFIKLKGLTLEQALELRDLRAQQCLVLAKKLIPEEKIKRILDFRNGRVAAEIGPRLFLQKCATLWDGTESAVVDLEREYQNKIEAMKREGIGFLDSPLRIFFKEIMGAAERVENGCSYYSLDGFLFFCEGGGHHKTWTKLATGAEKLATSPGSVRAVKRSLDLSQFERLRYWEVPGSSWSPTNSWSKLTKAGAQNIEITTELMGKIQAATRLLDSATDLGMTREELATWVRGRLVGSFLPQQDVKPGLEQRKIDSTVPSVPVSKRIISTTVTELAKVLIKGGILTPKKHLEPDRRGAIFHDIANRFVKHLVSSCAYSCSVQTELTTFLSGDNLWLEVKTHDTQEPRMADALAEFGRTVAAIQNGRPAQSWSEIYPDPQGEQNVSGVILEYSGIKIVVSGRIDIVRRSSNGTIEVVDYKCGGNPDNFQELGQAQLALYCMILKSLEPACQPNAVLEVYSPNLKSYHFSFAQTEQYWQGVLLPELHTQLGSAKTTDPDLETIEVAVEAVDSGSKEPSPLFGNRFPAEVTEAFKDYIGNDEAVHQIKTLLAHAISQGERRLGSGLLLSGSGGLGKSLLARTISKAMGLPFIEIPGSALSRVDDLLTRIDSTLEGTDSTAIQDGSDSGLPRFIYPPLVLFLDEVHELRRKADRFLNFFEPSERRAVGSDKVGVFSKATLITATTDPGLLPPAFLTRFLSLQLKPYSKEEIAEILKRLGCPGNDGFRERLAVLSRLNPRNAKQRLSLFEAYHTTHEVEATEDGLRKLMRFWNVDFEGLTQRDHDYLGHLRGGPTGLSRLAALLRVDGAEIQRDIEPFLMQLGLIQVSRQGRILTDRGASFSSEAKA